MSQILHGTYTKLLFGNLHKIIVCYFSENKIIVCYLSETQMGLLLFHLSALSLEHMRFGGEESLKLNCPQSRDQNHDPSTLLSVFLYEKALWDP